MDEQRAAQIRAEVEAKLAREAAIRAEIEAKLAKELKEKQWNQLNDKANEGDAEAQFDLANHYFNGIDVAQNYSLAVEWYTKAAETGHLESQKKLCDCYLNGKGVDKDANEAVKWLTMAADAGDASCQCDLAERYVKGIDFEKNFEKAYHYYSLSANQGIWTSICKLGYWCYFLGNGVKVNYEQAVYWLRKAVENSNVDNASDIFFEVKHSYALALLEYGKLLEQNSDDKTYLKKAFDCYSTSADLGCSNSVARLGHCYQYGIGTDINLIKASELYVKAFDFGVGDDSLGRWMKEFEDKLLQNKDDASSVAVLSFWYKTGDNYFNDKRKYNIAIEWYTRAAELGHLASQKKLYDCYINGKGVDKDASEAIKWLIRAADAGDAVSQSDLANRYANGIDVEKNLEKAYNYYKLSAGQGCWISIANLGGWCYLWGNGVEKNYEQAIFWLEKALREYGMNDSQSVCEWARKAYAVALSDYAWEKEHNNPDDATLKEIFEMYKKSADLENTFGISNLGHCYQYGIGTDIDLYKADQLYLQAKSHGHSTDVFEKWFAELEKNICDQSDSGDIRSQALRGSWLLNGTHGEKNEDKALYYLSLAADQGNDFAQNQFAHYYLLKEDYERAYMLFKKSAFTNGDSMRCLGGICYLEGKGVKKDFTMAEYWLSRAEGFIENDKEWIMSKLGNARKNKYNCNNTGASIDNIPEGNRNLFINSVDLEIGTFIM